MPTFVTDYPTSFTAAGASKSVTPTVAARDMLAVVGITPDSTVTMGTPTGGGLTYTLRQEVNVSSRTRVAVWTAPVFEAQASFTLSITRGGSDFMWGFNCLRFSACSGIGASAQTNAVNGAPSLTLSTTKPGSTLLVVNSDWVPVDGSSRAYRTPTGSTAITPGGAGERTYANDPSNYTAYVGYHATSGVAGSKTVGLTAPIGQTYSLVAVELLAAVAPVVASPWRRRRTLLVR